ncbi:hypothetical protein LshimejAT787_0706370 [Lyophyllum shimeji]|uniref:Uncharacterized protein n=1 Tax=Lyophyllum shimeji TaxID=47721 RepID=A0A9P3PRN2_LYOSH|nr:hypothetical protein LshimejAT787_0706370 [Lyophyllum shimeji]
MAMQDGRGAGTTLAYLAGQAMLITLQQYGIPFAFTGSVACSIYGEALRPTIEKIEIQLLSADIVVSELKHLLARNHPTHFTYHEPSRRLRYRSSTLVTENASRGEIDIVFAASSLEHGAHLCTVDGVPLVPYSILLLQQLHVWDTTAATLEKVKAARGADVLQMLKVFRRREDFQHQPAWDGRLQAASVERVARFFEAHPSHRKEWQRMELMPNRQRKVDAVAKVPEGNKTEPSVHPETRPSPSRIQRPLPQNRHKHPATPSTTPLTLPQPPPETTDAPHSSTVRPASKKSEKLTRMQIRRLAAGTAVHILKAHGFPCAIFGSMACKLFGNPRVPNDVDILVLAPPMHTLQGLPPTQESLKDLLVASAPSQFVLKPARDPDATYRVLWFVPTPNAKPTTHKATKVDVLLPGVMHLPALPASRVFWRGGGPGPDTALPVLPFEVLLLQKLQGWDDHRKAEEERYQAKVEVDVADLEWLLGVGVRRYLRNRERRAGGGGWDDRVLFSEEFETLSRERVAAFCEAHPKWTGMWRGLGFQVP